MDSNHVPPRYQHGALPVELAARGDSPNLSNARGSGGSFGVYWVGGSGRLPPVRGFLVGFALFVVLSLSILSTRRGGLRRQLRFAARRLRLALALAGIYLVGSAMIRIFFPDGPVADFGPPLVAVALLVVFVVFGQEPAAQADPPAST